MLSGRHYLVLEVSFALTINKILLQLQPRFDFKLYFYIFHASNTDSHVYHFSIASDLEIHSFDWLCALVLELYKSHWLVLISAVLV